jgi:hypothetical protein
MNNQMNNPINHKTLNASTIVSITLVVAFVIYGIDRAGKPLTISSMIANHYKIGLPLMIIALLLHSFIVRAYLMLLRTSLGSLQFTFIVCMCVAYITLAFFVIIIDLNMDKDAHDMLAISTSMFALLSTLLYKKKCCNTWLFISEFFVVVTALVSAFVFYSTMNATANVAANAVAEYVFILCILLDKRIKILVIETSKWLENSFVLLP